MTAPEQLWQRWRAQLRALLPTVRATRVDGLALLALGLVLAGRVALTQAAAALPLAVDDASTERRLRRWLANEQVEVGAIWRALLPALLRRFPGSRPLFVFDPTPQLDHATVLAVGLVVHRRTLPVAWRLMPQQAPWPRPLASLLGEMLAEIRAALPAAATPTLLMDRGLAGPALIDVCRAQGWGFVIRLNAHPRATGRVRLEGGEERRVWDLVTRPGQRWRGPVALFKAAGWRQLQVTIHWERRAAEPWLLLADEMTGAAAVRAYRRRAQCEATYLDCKSRGWDVEATKLRDPARLDRLLLALQLAFWWTHQLGLGVIRAGRRHCFDRHDRRDLSVVKLGLRDLADRLAHARLPGLLFAFRDHEWRLRCFP